MNRRRDYKTALLIDAVCYSASAEVRSHAADGLAERPLPRDFAIRIFQEPARRRHNPSRQPAASAA
ncbi:hypothetical protein SRABI118_04483 [Massilia sp. Bi118]|uniref:hypothetical protein n=1 Tax=Massilia sp. Bi118 TaxID=2822346 RepID=UPI001D6BC7BA|nr:hypothetical protein [Massilia sp. Bi118]CAH0303398.1 hypothetical protein SRABI118_04483 [Massilia sp. Bi118]